MSENIQSVPTKRFNEALLNMFAIIMAFMPLISVGYWVQHQFFNDPRRVVALSEIEHSDTPRLFEEPLVSVTFDDGWESVYSNGAPLLEKYDVRTTQYILPGQFDSLGYISLEQAHSLKYAGHEITSHTMTHPRLTSITTEQAVYELTESKRILAEESLLDDTVHFAAPESATNPEIMAHIRALYGSHRNTYADLSNGVDSYDVNTGPTIHRYDIIGFSVRSSTTEAEITAALDYAAKHNGWLVLVYHQIDDSNTEYSVTPAVFEQHLRLIRDSRIKTASLGDVVDTWSEEGRP